MADWIQGFGKETFLISQKQVYDRWAHTKSQWEKGQGEFNMEKRFLDLMDASCAQALDFESFVNRWTKTDGARTGNNKLPFSLTHGDYHPGNFLYLHSSSDSVQNKERLPYQQP